MRRVATVWCGRCTAQRSQRPGKLGEVEALGEVVELPRRLLWHGYDPPGARRLANVRPDEIEPGQTLTAGHYWQDLNAPDAPQRLRVWCRAHGAGTVSTDDVRAARGNVSLDVVSC